MLYQSTAPGSAMVMGEHAVLRGYGAIVVALNCSLTATVELRQDDQIHLYSDSLGKYQTSLSQLTVHKPWQFVLQCLVNVKLPQGVNLTIHSNMSHEQGLGSSAAVTVATLAALWDSLKIRWDKPQLFKQARQIIRAVQGRGSGADVAASVYGGVLYYQAEPTDNIIPLQKALPLRLLYSGAKVPTVTVIQQVNKTEARAPDKLAALWQNMAQCTEAAKEAILNEDWGSLGLLCNDYHHYMNVLGVSNLHLNELCDYLRHQPQVWGSKISGSGLGDSVLAIGEPEDHPALLTVVSTSQGVQRH